MSLRHALAGPLLTAHRIARRLSGAGAALRMPLLHDTPAGDLPALDRLAARLAPVSPDQAGDLPASGGGRRWLFTFDDGFASNLAAAEVLERHGARGLFFVCPGLIDLDPEAQRAAIAANIFDGKRAPPEGMRLMTWDEVRVLAKRGHAIGSHTLSHRRLTLATPAELETEIAGASAVLTRELGRPVPWFAFPFGDIDSIDAAVLQEIGRHHRWCRSGIRGANPPGAHPLALFADHVDLAAPAAYQDLAAEGGLDRRYAEARRRLVAMTQ